MASFSVDITSIRFAGARTGYKVVTISNAPAAGISIANTSYGTYYRVIVREANRYYEIQTKGTYLSSDVGIFGRNSVVRFYNTDDSTDYVEVNVCQAAAPRSGSGWCYYDDVSTASVFIDNLYFENESSTKSIYIDYASGVSGEVLSGNNWLSVVQGTPAVTDTGFLYFNISVISNYDSTRNGQAKFSNSDDSYYTVSNIEQAGGAATDVLAVTPSSIEFGASGGSRGITLDYRGTAYNMNMTEVMSWADISMSSVMTGLATGVVTVGSNTGASQRSGKVYFSDNGSPWVPAVELNITQAAPVETLTVSPSSLSFSSSGGTKTLAVSFAGSLNTNAANMPEWLDQSYVSVGQSSRTYTVQASANNTASSRSFDWIFQDDNMTKTVPITQAAGVDDYSVSPSSVSFSSGGGTSTVSLYYQGGLYDNSVSSRPGWVTVDFGSGNPAPVLITAEANTGASRSGSVVFYNSVMQDSCTLAVSQDSGVTGPSFSVSPSVVSFTASGGSQSLVFTDTPSGGLSYEVLSGSSWLSFSFVNDTVTAASNSSTSSRTGSIKFWNQDDPDDYVVVGVEQAGYVPVPVLTVSPSSKSFAYTGGSQVFNITYSDSLSFNTLPSWLSGEVSYVVAGESARYTMTAAENTGTSSRSFSWVISDESSSVTVQVYQAGRPGPGPVPATDGNLRASKTKVVIGPYNSDATVELYGVHSSGYRYTIDYQDGSGWCSVSSYSNYVVISRIGDNQGSSKIAKIRFYQQDDSSDYVDVWVTNASDTNIIYKIWRSYGVTPADRVPGENYHYRIMLDNSTNIYEGIAVAPSSGVRPDAVDIAGVARDYSVIHRRTPNTSPESRNLSQFGYPVDLYVYNGDTDDYITRARFWENYDNIYYGDVRDNICYAQVLNDPVNSKGCPGMNIPICVYEDDSSRSYSVVTDSGVDSLNISSAGFLMNNYKYDNTGYVEFKRGNETVMKFDMNHCGKAYLWYLNRFGGWDVFLIEGNIYKKESYTRDGYMLNTDAGSSYAYRGQKHISRTNIDTVYEFSTGWLTDDESERFVYHILSSGFVWLKFIEEEYKYDVQMIPVNILDTSAEYKKFRNGKRLVNYTVTVEAANTKRLQS